MNSSLQKIEIRNFKAFREFTLDLSSPNLLVYGSNGSGKSSLYWALYTFLQSACKPKDSISKYFDPNEEENLLNIHEQKESAPKDGEIVLTLHDATKGNIIYSISNNVHGTHNESVILKGDLASDFITYRFFFGFSHFRNSENFNIWPLFEKEILPFCVTRGGRPRELEDRWKSFRATSPNSNRYRGKAGAKAFRIFNAKLKDYSESLKLVVNDISDAAQIFYDTYFAEDDSAKISLKLCITAVAYHSQQYGVTMPPVLRFGIQVNGVEVKRPQSFLNEAKMTQFALSVRFAASLVNLHESDLKLLVLDDLLVSLDMSNRMKVVEILLSDTFANYQKIILTHDFGFFREFRRKIGSNHPEWCFLRLEGTSNTKIEAKNVKSDFQKAEDYLHGHNLDEAALCLRKACEDTVQHFLDRNNVVDPMKEFTSLREDLRAARNKIHAELPVQLYEKVIRKTPDTHRNLLVASSDHDIDNNTSIDEPTKGKLKCQRNRLRQLISVEHVERLRQIKLIDDILACTERVLNPAAHAGNPPLYEEEVQDALDLISQLETTFTP